jgi:methionyl-tRNA synthetase
VRRTKRHSPDAIFKKKYEGRYCIYDNLYVSDTPEPANCPICGRPAELISEENYFFRLSAYQQRLLDYYKQHPDFVRPDFRLNEVVSFVESGLKDLSISRKSIKWGIPWPDDPEQVFYVWYDALSSYMSGLGFVDGQRDAADYKRFWPADVHMIGKEIIRFHAVYWPAFLMAANLPLPKEVFAHGWLLFEQEKMSKSKGNVAYPEPIVKTLGNDALRYYLLRETVFGQDGNFSRDALIIRYNADLANGLGNLASRTLTMITNYCGGVVPQPKGGSTSNGELAAKFSRERLDGICEQYTTFQFSAALESTWDLIAAVDKYLVVEKPWALATDASQKERLERVLYDAAESIRIATVLAHPVVPEGTEKIWRQLGQAGTLESARVDRLQWGGLKAGTRIGKPEAVFPRVDKQEISERIEAMEEEIRSGGVPAGSGAAPAVTAPASAAPAKISIEDFAKVDMRAAVVKSAEKIQGADKLLKLVVDIGSETRQIVSGIAETYKPEDLIGKKVVVVTNLMPRKLRGVESNGMVVAASVGAEGKPVLCTFTEDVPPGTRLK